MRGEDDVVEAVLRKVSRRTRVALIDHVTSSTALVFPVERLVQELERRGVETLVDGAHAPGLVSLNLSKLNPSYYTANLHKWVCAPKGAAFLWARQDKQRELQPAIISHGNNTSRPGFSAFQDRFDWAGTLDPTAWFCAGESIRWLGEVFPGGWPSLRDRNRTLAVNARALLCAQLQVEPPCPDGMLAAMATIPLPPRIQGRPKRSKIDPEQLRLYDSFGIEVPFFRIGKAQRRYFRISAQLYNTIEEYAYLARALAEV
jgi:isopenicillin-N epimerase